MISGDCGGFVDFSRKTLPVEEALQKLRIRQQDWIAAVFKEKMVKVLILLNGVLEFSRSRKSMSVLCSRRVGLVSGHKAQIGPVKNELLVKGAPELLLDRCSSLCCDVEDA